MLSLVRALRQTIAVLLALCLCQTRFSVAAG
jgi:hypothetical protein